MKNPKGAGFRLYVTVLRFTGVPSDPELRLYVLCARNGFVILIGAI
jgi:hypothetical protein